MMADEDVVAEPRIPSDPVPASDSSREEDWKAAPATTDPAADELNGLWERQAKRMARNPCTHLCSSMLVAIALSAIAMIVGEFTVSANTGGWQSRGTLIADRQAQNMVLRFNQIDLAYGGDEAWDNLIDNVQPGWEDDDDSDRRRRLAPTEITEPSLAESLADLLTPRADRILLGEEGSDLGSSSNHRAPAFRMTPGIRRTLQENLAGCDIDSYGPESLDEDTRLWPVWRTVGGSASALDPIVLADICEAEANTQALLEERGLCFGCEEGCLPPYSVVLYARTVVENGFALNCAELADAWAPFQADTEASWAECVSDIKATYDPAVGGALPSSCPDYFSPALAEEDIDATSGKTRYTSSVFATTYSDIDALYEEVDNMDRGSGSSVQGAYDTQYESFVNIYVDEAIPADMALALGSAFIVAVAIVIHTRSPFITLIGLLQIVLSFPLSYFVYKLIAGLDFFPFLNFIGIFVVFALGAGDVFVAVDKWKNARLEHPGASTEFVAAVALPDAAMAMFLTTLTTAVAFFATALCPVAPIKMFAIFCGLLIMFDYIMNVLLVFPALCIYDQAIQTKGVQGVSFCMTCTCFGFFPGGETAGTPESGKNAPVDDDDEESGYTSSLIRRVLLSFYQLLHSLRWVMFVLCLAGLGVSIYFASTLELPTSSDVRLLEEENQFEQNYQWRQELLFSALEKAGGSSAYVTWGVTPADTGDQNDPGSWTQLVLDDGFEPSSEEAQVFLRDFCGDVFEQDWALVPSVDYVCPINRFDLWLQEQSNSTDPDEIYATNCAGATSMPVPQESFDACLIAWTQSVGDTSILAYQEKVAVVFFPFTSRVRYDSPFGVLDDEWNLIENWMREQNGNAPAGVNSGYFTSFDFWFYDTNEQMLQTAYAGAAIALSCAAIVILFSSRSLILTVFCTMTIGYVLTSVTATLVGLGWTLGFLESICFAILIGVSVDFVIHLAHAYTHLPGEADRGRRIKYALIKMGPSILATALTTILSATVMLFTVITFFQKFALILFFTIIQSTVGSLVVFATMMDCVGPNKPTYFADKLVEMCRGESSESVLADKPAKENDSTSGEDTQRQLAECL